MGSDGTLGLRAIKEQAGAVFVQAPASAKFDAMPRSAIDAGVADVVAPAEELAGKIVAYLAHTPNGVRAELALASKTQSAIEKKCNPAAQPDRQRFFAIQAQHHLPPHQTAHGLAPLDSIAGYVSYLQESPQEAALLLKELLVA